MPDGPQWVQNRTRCRPPQVRCQPPDTCPGVLKCRPAIIAALVAIRGRE
jgi:hypothetical protein